MTPLPKLGTSDLGLKSYCGTSVDTLGSFYTTLRYKNKYSESKIVVVKTGNNILGLTDLNKLEIIQNINQIEFLNPVVEQWKEKGLFDRISLIKKHEMTLKLKGNAKPHRQKMRSVPIAFKDKVKDELKILQKEGVLTRVAESEWASSLVIVEKSDKSFCLCGDFRMLNDNFVSDFYPLPNIQELLTRVEPSAKYFSIIDMCNAYFQIPLEEKYQRLTTLVTEEGTFCYTRTPFGIKTAPSFFQRILSEIVKNCKGALNYLDDILIMGKPESELFQRTDYIFKKVFGFK